MHLKKAAHVGKAIGGLLESENAHQEQLSFDLKISEQMIGHMKNERRKMQQDIAKESIQLYDNPEYIIDILHEFSNGYTPPVFRGKHIEQNRLALALHVKRELVDAIHRIEEGRLEKPPGTLTKVEREQVERLMDSLLTCQAFEVNLLKQLQVEYRISVKDRVKALMIKWRAVGWV